MAEARSSLKRRMQDGVNAKVAKTATEADKLVRRNDIMYKMITKGLH